MSIPSIHSYNKIYFDINFMMENTLCVVCFVCISGWQNLYLIKLEYYIICSIFVFGCCTREKSSERHLGKLKSINVEKHLLESMWMILQINIFVSAKATHFFYLLFSMYSCVFCALDYFKSTNQTITSKHLLTS